MGGYIFRTLTKHGIAHQLDDIPTIRTAPIGKTTFGDIIRDNRNRLMVHRDLSVASLPAAVRAVPKSQKQRQKFAELMARFLDEFICSATESRGN
jgi:hypothetical protein